MITFYSSSVEVFSLLAAETLSTAIMSVCTDETTSIRQQKKMFIVVGGDGFCDTAIG